MRVVVQRSGPSKVSVKDQIVGEISHGLVLLVCLEKGDTQETLIKAARKILNIRLFNDPETGKMNLNIDQVKGEILAISQFTLSWKGEKGNRPGFDQSMPPEEAEKMFNLFCQQLEETAPVAKGMFGQEMHVDISNLGPVTFSLDF